MARWTPPWCTPPLELALDDAWLGKTSTRITVEPRDANRERWQWSVEVLFGGTESLGCWLMGGSWRHPEPYKVCGRTRDEGAAWEQARECVADWNTRKAAEVLRRSMTHAQEVPQ